MRGRSGETEESALFSRNSSEKEWTKRNRALLHIVQKEAVQVGTSAASEKTQKIKDHETWKTRENTRIPLLIEARKKKRRL